ncbi:MAG: DUF3794 domain-containing protein [Ruminococcaceae bacterium]|nr:DUF3794 domain-containing protein [Oscillospiraceae bacterium]
MELKLEWEHINGYEMLLDSGIYQEETLETIVPDACPDILRIVDAGGQICLSGKNVYDGGVSASGTVKGWVVYQPEGGDDLCRVAVQIPFDGQLEVPGLQSNGRCVLVPTLKRLDARALNPRKMLLRADIGIGVQAYANREQMLCSGITCGQECAVQQRTQTHIACVTAAVEEKEFTFYDEVRLAVGPSGRAEVLSVQADAYCTESKVIGSKLIFKGEAVLQIRYQVEGELCSMRCPMAFSQIMEITQTGDDAQCDLTMCVTDVEYTAAGEDGRTINVTLELLGQAVVRDRHNIILLQDVYSTTYDMQIGQEKYTVLQIVEDTMRPQSVRELLETGSAVKNVVDCSVSVGQVRQNRESGQLAVSAELNVCVLYMNEQDQLEAVHRPLTVSGHLDIADGDRCVCRCQCPGEAFAVPGVGGVEVRFNVEFCCLTARAQEVGVVNSAKLGEPRESKGAGHPSVVLRMAAPGEELWDIAKTCGTTCEQIKKANCMDSDNLPCGQMLLIPSIR